MIETLEYEIEKLQSRIDELESEMEDMYDENYLDAARSEAWDEGREDALGRHSVIDEANEGYARRDSGEWLRDSVLPNLQHLNLEDLVSLAKDVAQLLEEESA